MNNKISGWIYYNHAVMPTTAPHEEPNINPIKDGSIWTLSKNGKKPLFARFTSNFDCGVDTGYWYVVKNPPFVFEDLDKKYQKNVLRALARCDVRRIDAVAEFESIYEVYEAAVNNYQNIDNKTSKERFHRGVQIDGLEYWGAYDKQTGKLAGWMSCQNNGDWTETISAKYHPELQSLRPSDAIHYAILNHYLNDLGQRYISSGTRNLNHKTNVQDYKIKNWHFRKAFCKLHLVYRKDINIIIKLLYPFRNLLMKFDNITAIHQLNSVLLMEKINRDSK
ncbi:MAG: hypothetical protein MJY63_01830 [Paludibacteraceae bacterium]|nr:hypothetical protein [Paludibacteraceae bacterium]